jgi:hypothetical protein
MDLSNRPAENWCVFYDLLLFISTHIQVTNCYDFQVESSSLRPRVAMWVEKGTLQFPTNAETPVIMIGPGTGCAPFRSFIQQRAMHSIAGNVVQCSDITLQENYQTWHLISFTVRVHGGDLGLLNGTFIGVKQRRPRLVLGWVNLQETQGTVNPSPFVVVDLKMLSIVYIALSC